MKQITALAVVLGLALAAAPVYAQQSPGPHGQHDGQPGAAGKPAPKAGMMGGQGMMGGMMHGGAPGMMQMGPGKHIEGRLAFLRAEIGITEAQAPVWSTFADAVRKSAMHKMGSMPMMQPKDAKADWPATMEAHEKMMASHLESLRTIRAAAQPLYAALNDDQKKIANELMMGPMGPMGGMGHMIQM
ncbi:MAG: Spy/CpxP family protein refolding chaperone [Rhodospirillales bacterium]|nr:Spy/CpxP family protein refolding chaperone [Rhodospirillales bacterium]